LTKKEKEVEEMFWHKDPRLMHRNKEYNRETIMNQLKVNETNHSLIEAYNDIIKFNEDASEYNIMVEAYE
jgi:hypothetical protein